MFYMLTSFDLKQGQTVADFSRDLDQYADLLMQHGLLLQCGPVGERQRQTILDTDDERHQQYYMLMNFVDKAQADRALAFIYDSSSDVTQIHRQLHVRAKNMVFTCWQDVIE